MLSIVTVNLNNVSGFEKTYLSITSQDFTDYEWIVIDGVSTDGSVEKIRRLESLEICRALIEPDLGIYDAMNKGIRLSSRPYILFLNSGDYLSSQHSLEIIIESINKRNSIDLLMFGFRYGSKKRHPRPTIWRYWSMPTSHQAMIYSRSIFEDLLFDNRYKFAADFDLTHKIIENGYRVSREDTIICVNEPYGSNKRYREVIREYCDILSRRTPRFYIKIFFLAKKLRFFLS